MSNSGYFNAAPIRLIIFISVAVLHIVLILTIAFRMETNVQTPEPVAGVMKLVDVEELLPPPPPEIIPETIQTNTEESIAENMIETDVEPSPVISTYTGPISKGTPAGPEHIEYLRQDKISEIPVLPDDQIRRNTVYPPIAQRSNIEGRVILELFIDRTGNIRDVRILREDPPNRGFGEAAVNAFKGRRVTPAYANGEPVSARYRYPVSFRIR